MNVPTQRNSGVTLSSEFRKARDVLEANTEPIIVEVNDVDRARAIVNQINEINEDDELNQLDERHVMPVEQMIDAGFFIFEGPFPADDTGDARVKEREVYRVVCRRE